MTSAMIDAAPVPRNEPLAAWRIWILLAVACLAWLPGLFALPALDRDESRFAEASRQMVETGNYVDIRLGDAPRYNKPIGIYWLQAGAARLAGLFESNAVDRIWVYRFPSFSCGLLALLMTFLCLWYVVSPAVALSSALLLACTFLLSAESEIATTDAALLAAVISAQSALMRIWLAHRERKSPSKGVALGGWAAMGAGILMKGPVIVAVVAATALAITVWDRDWRWLKTARPLWGIAIVCAMVAPWAIAIGIASHGAFFQQSLGHDFAAKLAGGQETHGAPPGYYLALLSLTFWPATLFLGPALEMAVRRRKEPVVRFFLFWAVTGFAMFELVPTKLPHYILPAYPALAVLAALWIAEENTRPQSRWRNMFRYASCAIFALGTLAIAAAPFVLPARFGAAAPPWALTAAALAAALGGVAIFLVLRGRKMMALALACLCALVLYPTLVLGVAPELRPLWISERVAALTKHDARPHDPPLVSAGYAEPSLLFRLGGDTRLSTGEGAANISAAQGGLVLVEDRERGAFLAHLDELDAFAVPLDQFSGFDYSNGRNEHFTIYRVSQIPQEMNPSHE